MLEDYNNGGNKVNKGRTGAAENGSREMVTLRARLGSLHHPLSGIHLPLHLSCLNSEALELMVLLSDSEEGHWGRQKNVSLTGPDQGSIEMKYTADAVIASSASPLPIPTPPLHIRLLPEVILSP